jgi:glycine betaine/proline transport system substrate-binding protein
MKRILLAMLVIASTATGTQAADGCRKITIADMNWSSATLIAHIDRFILHHGYGCDAQLVPGDTMPTGTSMIEKGEPDIAPELWTNSFTKALAAGIAEKRLRVAGPSLSDGGEEGFWVPQYMVDKDPRLATIKGIIAQAGLFKDAEYAGRSAFYGCPAGWNCQISSANLFKALKLKQAGFELVDPGSGPGLAGAIAKAYERKQPWFGYYWAPTPILGKYKMVKVDFGTGIDEKHYLACISKADCKDPRPTMYPSSQVQTVTTEAVASKAPDAFRYLGKRSFTNGKMNTLLAWMDKNQADGDVGMVHFLKNNEAIWMSWVSKAVASKVKKALSAL